jgi:hypothetical protein
MLVIFAMFKAVRLGLFLQSMALMFGMFDIESDEKLLLSHHRYCIFVKASIPVKSEILAYFKSRIFVTDCASDCWIFPSALASIPRLISFALKFASGIVTICASAIVVKSSSRSNRFFMVIAFIGL